MPYNCCRDIGIFYIIVLSNLNKFLLDSQEGIGFQTKHKKIDIMCMNWDCHTFCMYLDNQYNFHLVHMCHPDNIHNINLYNPSFVIDKICSMLNSYNHNSLINIWRIELKSHSYRIRLDIISNIFFQTSKIQLHIEYNHWDHLYMQYKSSCIFYNFYRQQMYQ